MGEATDSLMDGRLPMYGLVLVLVDLLGEEHALSQLSVADLPWLVIGGGVALI